MTYYAGIRGFARAGIQDSDPRIECDRCRFTWRVPLDRPPPVWFLDGKAPRGWLRTGKAEDGTRRDMCPGCRTAEAAEATT